MNVNFHTNLKKNLIKVTAPTCQKSEGGRKKKNKSAKSMKQVGRQVYKT